MGERPGRVAAAAVLLALGVAVTGCVPSADAPSSAGTAAASVPAPAPAPPGESFEAVVTRVVDGDTLHASVAGRGDVTVRLIGIDTPETRKPDTPVQCWGREATGAMTSLAPVGSRITAAFQPAQRTDRFDRDLWDIWLADGRFLQGELVARGAAVARSYPPTIAHAAYLDAVQAAARSGGLGLWGSCAADQIPRHD